MKNTVRFVLDGKIKEVCFNRNSDFSPTTTVLNYLRSFPEHKGVKEGCAEGDCGACTVAIAEIGKNSKLTYKTVDSCLVFLPMIHGKQLITVENLAVIEDNKKILHPVQQLMVETNGSQCGYCTPGIVMSLFGIYKNHNKPAREIIEDALTGNLCRCTGYQPIIEAAEQACIHKGKDHFSKNEKNIITLLKEILADKESLLLENKKQLYFKPFTLKDALKIRKENPDAIIIGGSTDVALRQTKKKELLLKIIDISGIEELKNHSVKNNSVYFGSGLTIEQVRKISEGRLPALENILKFFGSLQIRNIATIGGNIGSASPIGDSLPVLFTHEAKVRLKSLDSERILRIEDFIIGYRKTDIRADEIITEVIVPVYDQSYKFSSYKISRRKDLDISTVSVAFRLKTEKNTVSDIIIAYGGMAATTLRALKTEKVLTGKKWCRENVESAMTILENEFVPLSDARAEAKFRKIAAKNLLMKFYLESIEKSNFI
ncbi:MAG: xanthine dehydrogenase small subunit [Bacteroidota bacterium]